MSIKSINLKKKRQEKIENENDFNKNKKLK